MVAIYNNPFMEKTIAHTEVNYSWPGNKILPNLSLCFILKMKIILRDLKKFDDLDICANVCLT
jgi:hypothetical protein